MKMKWIITALLSIILVVIATGCFDSLCPEQSEKENMDLIRHIHAEIAKGNVDVFDTTLTSNYVRHCQAMPPEHQEMKGYAELKAFVKEFIGATSNYNETFDLMIASGDTVAYITTMTGTQTGTMGGIPATGKEFKIINFIVHRFEDDKIAETWVTWDNLDFLRQLGIFPPPSPDKQ